MINLINLRDLIVSNFGIEIYGLVLKNKYIFYTKSIFKYIFYIFPFSLFNYIKFIQIIYKKDNIYYITNSNLYIITPIILNFTFKKSKNDETIDMTSIIKYYNSSIPFKFIIENNKLNKFNILNIKYISKGTITDKKIYIDDCNNKLLYELFK